jgi:hypothetical protein
MKKQIVTTMFAVCLISLATAMYAGETIVYETEIQNLTWEITGNSSTLEGLTIEHIGNEVIISTAINYVPDTFTITFYDENYEEVIINPPSGGSSHRTLYCSEGYEKIDGKCVLINIQNYSVDDGLPLDGKNNEVTSLEIDSMIPQSDFNDQPKKKYSAWYLIIPTILIVLIFIFFVIKNFVLNAKEENNSQLDLNDEGFVTSSPLS